MTATTDNTWEKSQVRPQRMQDFNRDSLAKLSGLIPACVCAIACASLFAQQNSPRALASVEGHILCSDGGGPARGAIVRLRPLHQFLPDAGTGHINIFYPPNADTDFNGYYRIASVPPGEYIISVHQAGYNDNLGIVNSILDHFTLDEQIAILATFPQITVAASEALQQDVVIHRAGSISGRLTIDSGGIPGKTHVTATLVTTTLFGNTQEKDRQHERPNFTSVGESDDRGVYRIAGLPPGKYRIQVEVTEHPEKPEQTGRAGLYLYTPEGLKNADEELIDISDGEEVNGMDINIPTRLLHSIGGIVTQGGLPVEQSSIHLHRLGDKDPCDCGASTSNDGSYRIDLLPPGTWVIEASTANRSPFGKPEHATSRKVTVELGENDALSVNIDLPTLVSR